MEKVDSCENNPENSFTTKVGEYILSGFSAVLSFKTIDVCMMYVEVKIAWKSFVNH